MTIDINRIATLVIITIVVIIGGVVCIISPTTLDFTSYIKDVAVAVGLLGVAHGIDNNSTP